MKPHEETWTEYMGVNTCGVKRATPEATIAVRVPDYPTAKLMAAAPELARRLSRRIGPVDAAPCVCHLTAPDRCTNCDDRDFLRNLGALP